MFVEFYTAVYALMGPTAYGVVAGSVVVVTLLAVLVGRKDVVADHGGADSPPAFGDTQEPKADPVVRP